MAKKESQDDDSHHFVDISLADLIQVGGVILGILSAFVLATTTRARLVIILITCATVLVCGVLYLLLVRRTDWRSLRIGLQVLLSVFMVAAAVYADSPAQAIGSAGSPAQATGSAGSPAQATGSADTPGTGTGAGAASAAASAAPGPSMQKTGYVLRPSSFIATNDQDKVDLDTGCPGWGDMYPHVGPSRCGGLADLIIEPDSLHTAGGRPGIIGLPPGVTGSHSSCLARLDATPNTSVDSIQESALRDGEVLCVRTDMGNTAVVHLDKITTDSLGQISSVTIDFQVWVV